ncbi:sensor histidine kinase [Nonomuraea endophytica]|uniref:sensor histidine kinase n=1 Tax=Nonomuraea endophytica TaxID=714136 RepID=UPI0037C78300
MSAWLSAGVRGVGVSRVGWSVSRWLAVVAAVLTVAALVMRALLPGAWSPDVPLLPDYAAGLAFPALGAFLLRRRPGHLLARLMCAGGLACAVRIGAETGMLTAAAAGDLELAALLRYPAAIGRVVGGMLLAGLLPAYSPDGRLPSPRWRPVVAFAVLVTALECVRAVVRPTPPPQTLHWPAAIPNPLAIEALAPVDGLLRDATEVGTLAVVVAGLFSLALRARGADAPLRRQLAWPLGAFALYVICLLAGPAFWAACLVATALVPIAIVASVLRHQLFGIEVLLGKALVGAGVAGVVSVAYLAASGAASLVVSGRGQLAGLAAALLAGAAFQPLRVRLRRLVDHAMYGPHGDPHRLSRRLAAEVSRADPDQALRAALRVTADGLAVRGLAVRIRHGATIAIGDPIQVGDADPISRHPDRQTTNGQTTDSRTTGGRATGARARDGKGRDGQVTGERARDGKGRGRQVTGRQVAGGQVAGGQVAGGQVAGGQFAGGQVGGGVRAAGRELPLVWYGEPVGTLVIGPPGARQFTADYAEELLWAAAPYIADCAHAVRMRDDLRRSRERLAAAREEERRLRDSLRAELDRALEGVHRSLREAGTSLRSSPSAADRLLGDVGTDVHDAAMRVRALLHGLSGEADAANRR